MGLLAWISAFVGVPASHPSCSLTVFLCCPMCFLFMKMLSELDKAKTSPVELAGALLDLNLGLAVPVSLGF